MEAERETVGLIGIGLVGTALAEHLVASGIRVVGYDIVREQGDRLLQLGGRLVDSPQAVAEAVDRLMLSLPDTDVVRDVIDGPSGVLAAKKVPSLVIDTTTGDPEQTVMLAEMLARKGSSLLEATICGSSRQLREKEAILMVGGKRGVFDDCRHLLGMLAERVFYVGPSGSGSKYKLATNLVLGLNRLVLAEGLVFAERLGLDTRTFLELLKAGPGYSVAVDVKGDKMLREDFRPESRIQQHCKDVSLMLKHARDGEQELPLSRVHLDILEGAIAAGDGELDTCAIIQEVRRRRAGKGKRSAANPEGRG